MTTRAARHNIIAGAFILAGLVIAVWVSFLLADKPPVGGSYSFTVRFSLADGASGLKRGSLVHLAGQEVGRVLDVAFAMKPAEAPGEPAHSTGVNVRVQVRSDVALYENAGVYLEIPLLGTLSGINIMNTGSAAEKFAGGSPLLEEGEVVQGKLAPPVFLAQAGFGAEQAAQLRTAITSMEGAVARVATLLDRSGPKLEAGVDDAQAMLADLRASLNEWSRRIDATAVNVEQASARLSPMLAKADSGLDSANAAVASLRSLIDDNAQRLTNIMTNAESVTQKLDQTTIEEVNAALVDGRETLAAFSAAVDRLSGVVGEQTPALRRTLANLRLMSDNLKLTAIEVRSQPWRLLHQPTTKELETQVLYDATRAYAEAASDLRAASEALQSAAATGPARDALLSQLTESLTGKAATYRQAERHLLDKLIEKEK